MFLLDTIYCDELELWFEDIFMEEFNVEMEEERSFRDVKFHIPFKSLSRSHTPTHFFPFKTILSFCQQVSELLISLHRQLKTGKVDEVVSFVHQNQKFIKAEFDFYKVVDL